ncbi:MAG: PspA/IM30 family protein [Candidatus Hydrogenedentes bacterium]|nr:PspA/IM30 family protein [Candidatus Hydrogenedentota bacterium]
MGIFTRARDIISSNINAMLDQAEDPEKIASLMVREMEDTLIELKSSCAGAKAAKRRIEEDIKTAHANTSEWTERAQRAVDKGRDDLAREALHEKRRHSERIESLENESAQCGGVIDQYQSDLAQLEEKLNAARERQRVLVQRHIHAVKKRRAQGDIRRMETSVAFDRFDDVEDRINRLEAESELAGPVRAMSLSDEIESLDEDDEIENELKRLKSASSARAS